MHAAEVEKGHVQVNGGGQMFERLAESEAQPCKAAQMRPNAKIGPLDMRCADVFQLGVSADWDWDRRHNFGGVVPFRAFGVSLPVELEQLGKVNVRPEVFFDGIPVDIQSVRRDLESASNALTQVTDKSDTVARIALSDAVGKDHLRFGVNRHPNILIAPLFRGVAPEMSFFGVNVSPKLIGLHKAGANIPHARVEESSALVSDSEKQRKNRGLVDASRAGYGANAHAFQQERDDLSRGFRGDVVPPERFIARFGECGLAGRATETLDSISSVESESLCFGVFAADACHVGFSLVFLREKPDNQLCRFGCGLRPRSNHAPSLAETSGGALSFLLQLVRQPTNFAHVSLRHPIYRNTFYLRGFDFPWLGSAQRCGHRCQWVALVLCEVKSLRLETVSN